MAGAENNRDKALDVALANIEKQFGKGSVMRLGDETRAPLEVIPTGAISLDIALGLGGRLPTINETKLLPLSDALTAGVTWADGNLSNYEFTGAFQQNGAFADVITTSFGGNVILENGVTPRFHHCVVDPR